MGEATTATTNRQRVYAKAGDFCRIFSEDMTGLYRLALVLTGEEKIAEQCFILSLEQSIDGAPVFKEWARSWARRTIVRTAIGLLSPKPGAERVGLLESGVSKQPRGAETGFDAPLSVLLRVPVFDRFVFAITVLERMREQDCSIWLGCSLRDVISARSRVLASLAEKGRMGDPADEFLQPAQVA